MRYKLIVAFVAILVVSYFAYSYFPTLVSIFTPQETVQNSGSVNLHANLAISESNPRWNHFPVKVFIDTSYPNLKSSYKNDVETALVEWNSAENFVSFTEVPSPANADIVIKWVGRLSGTSKDTIGDTNLKFLDTKRFKIIQSAEIQILTKEGSRELNDFDMVNVAVHEIGHALGLEHSDSKDSVMYPQLSLPSTSIKQISVLDTDALDQIYKLPAKPDLMLVSANATKSTNSILLRTRYFANISVTVGNEGLLQSPESVLQISADNETIKTTSVPKLEPGSEYLIFYGNLEVSGNFSSITLSVDPQNLVSELDERNNQIVLNIS